MDALTERAGGLAGTLDAEVADARERAPSGLRGRDLAVTLAGALGVLAAASALSALAPVGHPPSLAAIALLVLVYAAFTRIEFEIGSGALVPTQLMLVPMLFVLPAAVVPLAVSLGLVLGSLVDLARGRIHASRLLVPVVYSAHALGPALVLVLAGIDDPSWGDWPWLVLALVAQLVFELASALTREVVGVGVPARLILGAVAQTFLMDVLLAPVGFLAALAGRDATAAVLAVAPLALLFRVLAVERRARIDRAVELTGAVADERRVARTDVLTGLANRLAWEEALVDVAGGGRVGVVLGDVDRLKQVNDTHGHEMGDELIRAVAGAIRAVADDAVLVARLGGDEFGCLLPDADDARCADLARRLDAAVRSLPPVVPGAPVSASFGGASVREHGSVAAAIEEADRLAYGVKSSAGGGRRSGRPVGA